MASPRYSERQVATAFRMGQIAMEYRMLQTLVVIPPFDKIVCEGHGRSIPVGIDIISFSAKGLRYGAPPLTQLMRI